MWRPCATIGCNSLAILLLRTALDRVGTYALTRPTRSARLLALATAQALSGDQAADLEAAAK